MEPIHFLRTLSYSIFLRKWVIYLSIFCTCLSYVCLCVCDWFPFFHPLSTPSFYKSGHRFFMFKIFSEVKYGWFKTKTKMTIIVYLLPILLCPWERVMTTLTFNLIRQSGKHSSQNVRSYRHGEDH